MLKHTLERLTIPATLIRETQKLNGKLRNGVMGIDGGKAVA